MNLPQLIVCVDTETGGLDPKKHSLLTIAMVPIVQGVIMEGRQWLVKHETYRADLKALAINKIDLHEHHKKAESPEVVLSSLRMYIASLHLNHGNGEKLHLLGQNLSFDLGFLSEQFRDLSFFGRGKVPKFDTDMTAMLLKIHGLYPEHLSTSNEAMAGYYGIHSPNHEALIDAHTTAEIFLKQMNVLSEATEAYE